MDNNKEELEFGYAWTVSVIYAECPHCEAELSFGEYGPEPDEIIRCGVCSKKFIMGDC